MVDVNSVALKAILNTPGIVKEHLFLDLSSEQIIDLIDELNTDLLYLAVKTLLSRTGEEELVLQIKCLKKIVHFKLHKRNNILVPKFTETINLNALIKEYIKNNQGQAQLYGLICLVMDTGFSLPDELVTCLVITYQCYHWIPLLKEEQRSHCFKELLKNADTDKKYLDLIHFLSIDKEKSQAEIKLIVDDLLIKYPHFCSGGINKNSIHYNDILMILKILPVFLLRLNERRQWEFIEIILSKLQDQDEHIREVALGIINGCLPHLKDKDRELVFAAIHEKLSDKNSGVRFAAQKAMSTCGSHFKDHLKTIDKTLKLDTDISAFFDVCIPPFNDEARQKITDTLFLKLSNNEWIVRDEALQIISTSVPYLNAQQHQKIIGIILLKLGDSASKVRKIAAKTLVVCMPHISPILSLDIFNETLPYLNDDNCFVRESILEIICNLIPHLDQERHQEAFNAVLSHLNDNNWVTRDAVLHVMTLLIPCFNEENYQQVFAVILPHLNDNDWSYRYMVLQTLFLFIPHLSDQNCQRVLQEILLKLNDTNSIVRGMALQLIMKFIVKLKPDNYQAVLDGVLLKLNDCNSFVVIMARKAIATFMPYLDSVKRLIVLETVVSKSNSYDSYNREIALKDIMVCMPYINDECRQNLFKLIFLRLDDDDRNVSRAAMQALVTCIPQLNDTQCHMILEHAFPKLMDENWVLCDEALKIILTCSIYSKDLCVQTLNEQLTNYINQNSLTYWYDELCHYYAETGRYPGEPN